MDGVDADATAALVLLLDDATARTCAALALLLGGSEPNAALAVAKVEPFEAELRDLKTELAQSFEVLTTRAYEDGSAARWVALADRTPWARQIVGHALARVEYRGPRTLSRVLLRARLYADARSATPTKKRDAFLLLHAMNERGVLAALAAPVR